MMNISPTSVMVNLDGNILESTQVTKTAVGVGLSLTRWNCCSMFLCLSVRYFMIPWSTLLIPRDPFVGIFSERRKIKLLRSTIDKNEKIL